MITSLKLVYALGAYQYMQTILLSPTYHSHLTPPPLPKLIVTLLHVIY